MAPFCKLFAVQRAGSMEEAEELKASSMDVAERAGGGGRQQVGFSRKSSCIARGIGQPLM